MVLVCFMSICCCLITCGRCMAAQLCCYFASLPPAAAAAERNIHFKSCLHLAMKRFHTKVMIIYVAIFCICTTARSTIHHWSSASSSNFCLFIQQSFNKPFTPIFQLVCIPSIYSVYYTPQNLTIISTSKL